MINTTLSADLRRILDGTPIAHIATILPDGGPHSVPIWIATHDDRVVFLTGPQSRKAANLRSDPRVAISLTPEDNPFEPVVIRGQVTEWLDGDPAWAIIDRISVKYLGAPYPREDERIIGFVDLERHSIGMGT